MLTPTRGLDLAASAPAQASFLARRENPARESTSFSDQLVATLESHLALDGQHPVHEFPFAPTPRQDLVAERQLPAAGTSGGTSREAARQLAVELPQQKASGELGAAGTHVSNRLAPSASVEPPPPPAAPVFRDAADAYWAMQPEEVRVLRTISDPSERGRVALELSQRGFIIDNEIMIHGWDPYMTMKVRKESGYTWFPSLGQNLTPVAPGLSFPGLPSYDPSNPPRNSIAVSTDFAIGLEHTSPCGLPQRREAAPAVPSEEEFVASFRSWA